MRGSQANGSCLAVQSLTVALRTQRGRATVRAAEARCWKFVQAGQCSSQGRLGVRFGATLGDPLEHQVGWLVGDRENRGDIDGTGISKPSKPGGFGAEVMWWWGGVGLCEDAPPVREIEAVRDRNVATTQARGRRDAGVELRRDGLEQGSIGAALQ